MKYWKYLLFYLILFLQNATAAELGMTGKPPFDYYLMSLSWSPEFCATHENNKQCGRGYGLVLHGLWPQYFNGYPKSCSRERITAKLVREFSGLYPAEGLAFHEWQKHGTCSGLAPRDYLLLSQQLKNAFVTPESLKNLTQPMQTNSANLTRQILQANPKLNAQAIAFDCTNDRAYLQEVYICFDQSGKTAVACGEDVQRRSRQSCGSGHFSVRSLR